MTVATRYLEITYRRGKALAAYLYLPREAGDISQRVEEIRAGYLVDRAADGRAIGIEMKSPRSVTLDDINAVLAELAMDPLESDDLAPLAAA
jgi:hypothetical protein